MTTKLCRIVVVAAMLMVLEGSGVTASFRTASSSSWKDRRGHQKHRILQEINGTNGETEAPDDWCGTKIGVDFGLDGPTFEDLDTQCECAKSSVDESTLPAELMGFALEDVACVNNCATCFERNAYCGFIETSEGFVNDEASNVIDLDETCITYDTGESGRLCIGSNTSAVATDESIIDCYIHYNGVYCNSCQDQYTEETACLVADCTNIDPAASINACIDETGSVTSVGAVGPFRPVSVIHGYAVFVNNVTVGACATTRTAVPMTASNANTAPTAALAPSAFPMGTAPLASVPPAPQPTLTTATAPVEAPTLTSRATARDLPQAYSLLALPLLLGVLS